MQQSSLTEEYHSVGQELDELKATFVRNVEHELRAPVTLIQGYAELLSEGALGPLAPDQEEAIFVIANRAEKLRTLVERVSTLLGIKAAEDSPVLLALSDTAINVVETRRAKAMATNLSLELIIASDLPLVMGHPYYLRQAVDCLVENALKFTPSGGRIRVRVEADPGWVSLSVTDTGIGIEEGKLNEIFNSFYQIDGTTTRRYGGLGLGLTVTKAVVEAFSGRIEVQSQLDRGSRFTIKLPAIRAEIANMDQPFTQNIRQERILIVDDEEFVAATIQASLEKLPNCEVVTTTSGQHALQLCEQEPFDLVFTDYKMPDIDGLTLAARIRQLYPQTITIMITAYSNNELLEQAAGISIQRVLDKPVKFTEIRTAASEALASKDRGQLKTN